MKVYGFRVMLVFVMYYIYVTSGSSLLIESTDSMIKKTIISRDIHYLGWGVEVSLFKLVSHLSKCQ